MADTGRDVLAALGGGLANLPTCRLSDLLGSRKVGDLERWRAGVEKRGMGRLGRDTGGCLPTCQLFDFSTCWEVGDLAVRRVQAGRARGGSEEVLQGADTGWRI